MPASLITAFIAELEAALAKGDPQLVVLRKLARINEGEPSGGHIEGVIARSQRELDKVRILLAGARDLQASGYPTDLSREVPHDVLDDLRSDVEELTEVVKLFHGPPLATTLNPSARSEKK
jgi:hypothetical protein